MSSNPEEEFLSDWLIKNRISEAFMNSEEQIASQWIIAFSPPPYLGFPVLARIRVRVTCPEHAMGVTGDRAAQPKE